MNWQEFEENLKNRVDGHETPLDTDALWDKVRPRKRRRLLLLPEHQFRGGEVARMAANIDPPPLARLEGRQLEVGMI